MSEVRRQKTEDRGQKTEVRRERRGRGDREMDNKGQVSN
jgi:hypothetical protein